MNGSFSENEFINVRNAKYNSRVKSENIYSGAGFSQAAVRTSARRVGLEDDSRAPSEYVGAVVGALRRNAARKAAETPMYTRKKASVKKSFPFGFVISALCVCAVFMFITYNNSVVNEIAYETRALEAEIAEFTKENQRLSIELEQKNDLAYIEEIAVTKLGMVKSTDIYKQFVSLSGSDKVEVSENNSDEFALATTLNGFKRSVGKIFE